MVIAVIVAVVVVAVVGSYFALRPRSGQSRKKSELRTLHDEVPADRVATTRAPAAPSTEADRFEAAVPTTDSRSGFVPGAAAVPESQPEVETEGEEEEEVEYEIVEVVEYVEVDDDYDGDAAAGEVADSNDSDDSDDEGGERLATDVDGVPVDDDLDGDEQADEGIENVGGAVAVDRLVEELDELVEELADEHDDDDPIAVTDPVALVSVERTGLTDDTDQAIEPSNNESETTAGLAPALAEVIELDEPPHRVESELAVLVAELIDEADPEVADVMARLIDASDADLVSRLVDAPDLDVAELVARLVDAADPTVAALVAELAESPDRRDVAEVLRLVDTAYGTDEAGGEIPPEVAAKLDELDIEADLELTSRPGEMSGFAQLGDQDKLRVIIRVLCGLVGRDDLPPPRRGPRHPASVAEQRMWPLSRARWPVPPPPSTSSDKAADDASLPARRQSTKAS